MLISAPFAGTTLIQLFLTHLTIPVVPDDFMLIHRVRPLHEEGLELMPDHPDTGHPDVLVHGRRHGADHPAVPVAAANLLSNSFRLGAAPKFLPALPVQVTHDFLLPGAIAGHHIAERIDEESIETHVAGQQTLLAVNIVDEAMVEVGPEPLLGAPGLQQFVDQIFKIPCHHGPVVDDIVGLHKVEAVMQGRSREFHAHLIRNLVKGHQVRRILILYRHTKAHILHSHVPEGFQGIVAPVEAVVKTPDLVVGLFQALNGNTDADLRELPAQIHDPVRVEAVGRDDDPVTLFVQLPDDVLQILPDEGLTAGDIGKIHFRQFADGLNGDLLLRPGRSLGPVAHVAPCIAPVGYDHGAI